MGPPAVEIAGLSKRFGSKVAVDDVTLSVPAGSFFGICGPNGAGKTTLLRMVTGLLRPDAGEVSIDGHDVWSDPAGAKERFGLVPDDPTLFPRLTGREMVDFMGLLRGMEPDVVAQRRDTLLRLLGLTDDADTLITDYSLGMTKKATLAAALLHNPRVLFLDEPFAGLDPVARQTLERILARHTAVGGTVVFSDHAMDVVERLCDGIVILASGRVVTNGVTAEITNGRRLQDVFVELVGAPMDETGDMTWLGSSSD